MNELDSETQRERERGRERIKNSYLSLTTYFSKEEKRKKASKPDESNVYTV
jgi:hypothetical protein